MKTTSTLWACLCFSAATLAFAQDAPPPRPARVQIVSPEVNAERMITFRVNAPKAESVRVTGGDLPSIGQGVEMKKAESGVWEATVGPAPGGAFRYLLSIDGVATVDPANPLTSQSNMNTWSLVNVAGSDVCDLKNVPHGAVAAVNYRSKSLDRDRRMHVYTPPGYETSSEKYPVFYLLHGASDSDNSWSSVGRAGFIIDNLIAAGKAKPMIVVMPHGHTGAFSFGGGGGSGDLRMNEFVKDFNEDIKPYVESHYRIAADRAHRAIAGLSMGGAQTLDIAFPNLQDYAYIGVYSSGVFGIAGGFGRQPAGGPSWESRNEAILDDAKLKEGLKLVWFATGKEDFLLSTSKATVDMLKKHKFDVQYQETAGGHTWLNWRDYLHTFAQLLFQ